MYRSRSLRIGLAGLAAVLAIGASSTSFAVTKYWVASGGAKNWSTPANWSPSGVPGMADDVILSNTMSNNDVIIDLNVDIASLTVQNGYAKDIGPSGSQTIRIRGNMSYAGAAGFSLTASVCQIDGSVTVTSGELRAGAGTLLIGGDVTLADQLTASSGPVTIGGTLTVSGTAGRYEGGSGALTVGAMALSGGQFNGNSSATGTVTVTGNVTVSGTHTFTANSNAAATIRIGGMLAISGGTFTANSGRLEVGGFNKTGGTFTHSSGTVMLNGTTSQTFGATSTTFNNLTINDGLVGYWKLDDAASGPAVDSSGYGNNLTWTNSPASSSSVPSLLFTDTTSTLFATADRDALLTAMPSRMELPLPITLSAWYRATAIDTNAGDIISGKDSYVLRLTTTGIGLAKHTGSDMWSELSSTAATTSTYLDGNWHHVAGVLNSTGGMSIYYDGTLVASNTNTAAVAYTNSGGTNLAIGRNGGTNATCDFGGNIDEVRIYKRALSLQDIKSLARGAEPATSVATHTMTGSPTILGNLVIASGALAAQGNAISVRGSWLNYGGQYTGSGAITLTGTSATGSILSGGQAFGGLTLNGSGGTYTLADRLWVSGGTVTLTAGTLNASSYVAHIGSFAASPSTFTPATGTVVLDATSNTTLPLASFYGLRLEDSSETSLVGYWKFDEGSGPWTRDWSGSGNTGTLASSGVYWATSSGTTGFDNAAAMGFDGTAGYVSGGTTGLPAANVAQTISVWANFSSATATQSMVALTATGSAIRLGLGGGAVQVLNSGGTVLATATAPSAGAWHHIVYVYDPSQATAANRDKIYIDGTATTGTSGTHDTATPTGAFIGATSASANFFNGRLDDVRVYSAALTQAQVSQLAAGRYAGTGGYATVTLGANTTVSNTFAVDAANLTTSSFTFNPSLGTAAAAINTGTYTVGSAAQTFTGGLTVQANGTLALPTSGGSVQIATGKTLTMDGTLTASNTGATIRSVSGTYTFTIGSTAAARPTLNITGLAVRNTDANGMRINANTSAITTFTRFDNITFTAGTTTFLNIYATSLYLPSSGCSFGVSDLAGVLPTNNITLTGNGTGDGETRMVLGTATCHSTKTTSGYCNDSWAVDDDSNNDGVGDLPTGNEAVVQYIRGVGTDTAGTVEGFPTAAFDWNTFAYYSTYVAFHDASGTVDRIYVRGQTGAAEYSWDTPSNEEIVGTPRWVTVSGVHYLYVATASGKVYRLIDNTVTGTLTTDTTSTNWSGGNNPFDCGCTIKTPLSLDATNLYWAGTTAGPVQKVWTLGQASRAMPTVAFTITPVVTSASPTLSTSGGISYLFLGLVGNIIKLDVTNQTLMGTNTNPGSASINGRVSVGGDRVFAGDSAGNLWAIAIDSFTGVTAAKLWQYPISGDSIQSSPFYDFRTTTVHFGTELGKIVAISAAGVPVNGYPFTPDLTTDAIRAAPLYLDGILAIGTTTGKLYFYDRNDGVNDGAPPVLLRKYYFGPTQAVSGIGYDSSTGVNRYMVSTSDPTTKDGRLYFIDAITDPTVTK